MRQIQRLDREAAQALSIAVAERLGLDPAQISAEGLRAEYMGGTSPVVVRWEGVATFTVEEWDAIVAAVQ